MSYGKHTERLFELRAGEFEYGEVVFKWEHRHDESFRHNPFGHRATHSALVHDRQINLSVVKLLHQEQRHVGIPVVDSTAAAVGHRLGAFCDFHRHD